MDCCILIDFNLLLPSCYTTHGSFLSNSKFSRAFQQTAHMTKARVKHDRFDTSIIELAKPDLTKFMEHLQMFA